MASLLEKVNTLISANLHWMVDQALKQNSIAVINQYIREVEDNLDDLTDTVGATVGGNVKTIRRKRDEFQAKADGLNRNIDIFLREGRDDLGRGPHQSKLNSTQRLLATYSQQLDQMQAEYQNLMSARLKLEAKLTSHTRAARRARGAVRAGEIQKITAKTMKSLDNL